MDRTPPGSPIFRILGLLEGVRKQGSGWEARCPGPSHKNADRHPSLSVGTGADGRALLHCQAGCTTDDVLAALGLDFSALFEKDRQGDRVRRFNLYANGHVVATHVRVDKPDGKRIHWERNGHNGLDDLPVTELPLYGAQLLAERPGEVVYLCEGEKAAQALIDLGLLAVATVTGAATIPSDTALAVLQGRLVRVWPDNDADGLSHMLALVARLVASTVAWVRWPEAPEGGDAADYVELGGSAEDLEYLVEAAAQAEPQAAAQDDPDATYSAASLIDLEIPQPRWAVPGYWPEGVVLLVGRSKLGKSFMALDAGIAIASGGLAWNRVQVEQGDVLYLALEDNKRRMQDRLYKQLGRRIPERLYFRHRVPRVDEGGLELVLGWLNDHPDARLVVIDILGRFRPREVNKRRLYDQDYESIAPIAELARARGVCVCIVHHANKLDPEDVVDSVSGTTGLAGAADAIGILRRARGQDVGELLMTGRDIEETENAFRFAPHRRVGYAWELLGDAHEHRMSEERREVVDAVKRSPGCTPAQLADDLGRPRTSTLRGLLARLVRDGDLRTFGDGKYWPPLFIPNPINTVNSVNSSVYGVDRVDPVEGVEGVYAQNTLEFIESIQSSKRTCRWCGRQMPHSPDVVCKFPEDKP